MTTYYNILDTIKNQLLQDPFCNQVSEGSIWEIDLDKQTIMPYSHIQVNNATLGEYTTTFNISVFCMDIVDKVKDSTTDKFKGNDNEQDVLNTQFAVASRLLELMRRGSLSDNNFQLKEGTEPSIESFTERFSNFFAGWAVTFDVDVPNEMTVCDVVIPSGECADAVYSIQDTNGNVLFSGNIVSGGALSQVIGNSTVNNSDNSYSTDILAQSNLTLPDVTFRATNSLGDTVATITSPSVVNATIEAPDSNYLVQYVNGTQIQAGTIASDGSVTVNVPNPTTCSDATVSNSDDSFSDTVVSGGNLELSDISITLKDSSGTTINTSTSPSVIDLDITAPDADYTVEYQNGTLIESGTIKSDGSKTITVTNPITCSDADIEINSTPFTTVSSGGTVDIQLKDSDTDTITPLSTNESSGVITIELVNHNKLAVDMFEGRVSSVGGTFEAKNCLISSL